MSSRTRYVLLGGGAVLLVGLLAGGVAYVQGGIPAFAVARPAQPGLGELRYVPAEASFVAYASVRDVMQSNLRERLGVAQPDVDRQGRFFDETGVDLENDIDYIVAGFVSTGTEPPAGLVLLTGCFDHSRLEFLAREQGGAVEEYEGHTLVTRAMGHDETELAMSFVESGVLALGSDESVRHAIDVSSGRAQETDITSNDRLMALMTHVGETDNAWAIAQLEGNEVLEMLPGDFAAQIPPLTAIVFGGRVTDGLSATLTAETRDDQSSQDLRDVLQGFAALARMQTDTRPHLRALLDSVQVGGSERAVSLSFDFQSENLEGAFSESEPEPDELR
jgi:hypothetical protein